MATGRTHRRVRRGVAQENALHPRCGAGMTSIFLSCVESEQMRRADAAAWRRGIRSSLGSRAMEDRRWDESGSADGVGRRIRLGCGSSWPPHPRVCTVIGNKRLQSVQLTALQLYNL